MISTAVASSCDSVADETRGSHDTMDVVILSNGPGEISTWVRPVAEALRRLVPEREHLRISVVLAPCPLASGGEFDALRRWTSVDRVQGPDGFATLLRTRRTAVMDHWHTRGLVLFLGGDQLNTWRLARRLGYRSLVYAERSVRWKALIDRFALAPVAARRLGVRTHDDKFCPIGDLMVDVGRASPLPVEPWAHENNGGPLFGVLPGSKPAKLAQGVPFMLGVVDRIHRERPGVRFMLPLAPTLSPDELLDYVDPHRNPMVGVLGAPRVERCDDALNAPKGCIWLRTESGARVLMVSGPSTHPLLARCDLCLTTVGANTAELAALGVPMLVIFLTHQRDALNVWTGLTGLITNAPLIGRPLRTAVNQMFFWTIGLIGWRFAWPNLWAGETVVPEILGPIRIEQGCARVLDLLDDQVGRRRMAERLRKLAGPTGAATRLAELVLSELGWRMEQATGDQLRGKRAG